MIVSAAKHSYCVQKVVRDASVKHPIKGYTLLKMAIYGRVFEVLDEPFVFEVRCLTCGSLSLRFCHLYNQAYNNRYRSCGCLDMIQVWKTIQ
jgi:hypothetical protein